MPSSCGIRTYKGDDTPTIGGGRSRFGKCCATWTSMSGGGRARDHRARPRPGGNGTKTMRHPRCTVGRAAGHSTVQLAHASEDAPIHGRQPRTHLRQTHRLTRFSAPIQTNPQPTAVSGAFRARKLLQSAGLCESELENCCNRQVCRKRGLRSPVALSNFEFVHRSLLADPLGRFANPAETLDHEPSKGLYNPLSEVRCMHKFKSRQ